MIPDHGNGQRILIAGGGIGGLAARWRSLRSGERSHVLEQSMKFGEIGAGIQLGPNVFRMFERMGLTRAVRDAAFFTGNLIMRDASTGEEVTRIPVGSDVGATLRISVRGHLPRRPAPAAARDACRRSPLIGQAHGPAGARRRGVALRWHPKADPAR